DFGIARANEGGEYKTRDGMFKGKLAYSAPEVYDGKSASPKSDVYSAAVVLYQLLSGENPFRGKDVAEIVRRVLTDVPGTIAPLRADVSGSLDEVLRKALSKDPEARYPTAAAFADALRTIRPRREEEFASDLADEIWNDFNGDMAEKLGIEPLHARDAAWRAATSGEGERSELRSTPPPLNAPPTATRVETIGSRRTANQNPTIVESQIEIAPAAAPAARGRLPFLAIASAVVAFAAAAYSFRNGQKQNDLQSRFVVVEKEARDEPADPATTGSAESSPSAASSHAGVTAPGAPFAVAPDRGAAGVASGTPGATLPDPTQKTVRAPSAPDPATLSRAVQRQRGRIESCFLSHVKEVDGRPEVSVRFRLAASGHVESADLSPAALGGTPLGQCLLGVARSTDFGPVSEPVSFTIPITARRVK
ncbi:MAG TPA: protein kinase, partial [Polyangiaceae bacterium]